MPEKKDTHSGKADFLDDAVFHSIVEQACNSIIVCDVHGKVMYANPAASNAYGYSAAEFQGIYVHELHSPETRHTIDEQLKTAREEGVSFRAVHLRRNGESFPVEVNSRCIRFADKEALVSVIRDIRGTIAEETALKRSENKYRLLHEDLMAAHEELTASEEELRRKLDELLAKEERIYRQNMVLTLLHEMALSLMTNLDQEDVLKRIISGAAEFFGAPNGFVHLVDEEKGTFTLKIGIGVFAELAYEGKVTDGLMGQAYKTGRIAAVDNYSIWEHRLPEPVFDGLHYFVLVPLKYGGRMIGAIGLAFYEPGRTLADGERSLLEQFAALAALALINTKLVASYKNEIEERKQTERFLRLSEEKFSKIFHISPDAVAIARADDRFMEVNEGFCHMNGFAKEEVIGKTSSELGLWVDPQDRKRLIDGLNRCGEVINQEFLFHPKDGSIRRDLFSARLININGENCVLTFSRDITERKRMEKALKDSEEKYRTIFDAANDAFYVHDARTGDIIDVNEKACALHGYTREEIFAGNLDIIGTGEYPYSKNEARRYLMKAAAGEPQIFEWWIKHKDGYQTCVEVSLKTTTVGNQETVLAIVRDISERKKAEMELHKSQISNQALINAIPDMMFIVKRDGTIANFRGGKEELFLPEAAFLGKTVSAIFPAELAAQIMGAVKVTLETGEVQSFEYQLLIYNEIKHYEARIAFSGEDEVLAICRNITDRKYMEEQLKRLSLHDALTGLYNRAFFEEEMKRIQRVSKRSMGLLICDVDGLKVVNDTLGHNMGDVLLKAVAEILKESFQSGDVVARIGGDEFAVIFPTDSVEKLAICYHRIRERIDIYNAENPTVPISLSMGYAVSNQSPADMDVLFKEADNNMYREKLHQQKSARSAIVQGLMKALEARDFLTEGHGDRLQDLIQSFASVVGLPESRIADLRLFAHFHDIGKVGIPDNILFKTGRLTEKEWTVMRRHCEIGYRIAMSTPDLAPIADWILKHQEWWNGGGYPLGLRKEDIPLECRMLAIVDAYDAMTSNRPYRKAMGMDDAIEELKRCAGTQFDPELVSMFCSLKCSELGDEEE